MFLVPPYCNFNALNQLRIVFLSPTEYDQFPVIKNLNGIAINIIIIKAIANGMVHLNQGFTGVISSV